MPYNFLEKLSKELIDSDNALYDWELANVPPPQEERQLFSWEMEEELPEYPPPEELEPAEVFKFLVPDPYEEGAELELRLELDNTIWYNEQQVGSYNPETKQASYNIPIHEEGIKITQEGTEYTLKPDQSVWIGNQKIGQYNPETGKFKAVEIDPGVAEALKRYAPYLPPTPGALVEVFTAPFKAFEELIAKPFAAALTYPMYKKYKEEIPTPEKYPTVTPEMEETLKGQIGVETFKTLTPAEKALAATELGIERELPPVPEKPFAIPGTERMMEAYEKEGWEPTVDIGWLHLFHFPWTPEEEREEEWRLGPKGVLELIPWLAIPAPMVKGKSAFQVVEKILTKQARGKVLKVSEKLILAQAKAVEKKLLKAMVEGKGVAKILGEFNLKNIAKKKVLTVAEKKLVKEITAGGERLTSLPSYNEIMWDATSRFAGKGEKFVEKPLMRQFIAALNPKLVARHPIKQLKIAQGMWKDMAEGGLDLALRPIKALKGPRVKRGIVIDARIKPLPNAPKVAGKPSMNIHDIVEYAERYDMPKELRAWFNEIRNVSKQTTAMLEKELVRHNIILRKLAGESDWVYLHRVVTKVGEVANLRTQSWRSMAKPRSLKLAGVGEKLPKPVKYLESPIAELEYQIQGAYNWIIDLRVKEALRAITTTAKERVAPGIIDDLVNKNNIRNATQHLKKLISRAKRAEKLPTVSLNAVDRHFPEIGIKLRGLVAMPASRQKTIGLNKLGKQTSEILDVAQKEFWRVKAIYRRALQQAGPTIEEGTTRYFPGRIFLTQELIKPSKGYVFDAKGFRFVPDTGKAILGRDVALEVEKQFGFRLPGVFEKITARMGVAGGILRETKASLDFSVQFIQTQLGGLGLDTWNLLTFRPSAYWIKGAGRGLQAYFMPGSYAKWAARPDIITASKEAIIHRLLIQPSEYTEALGVLAPLLRKTVVGKPAAFLYTRANTAFTAGRVSTATYLWMGERQLATKGLVGTALAHRLDELGMWINKATGVLSTSGMGVPATQRSLESVFLFAPRYTRAVVASVLDIARGGYTGAQAREALLGLITAGATFFTFVPMAMGQNPRLNPLPESLGGDGAKWLTFQVGNSYIGVGGTIYGLARLIANNWAALTERPDDLFKLDMNNPNVRFIRAKFGPPVALGVDYVTGQGFLGNLTRENWQQVMGTALDWLIPIWVESTIGEEWHQHLAEKEPLETHPEAALPELFGMRTIPVTEYDKYMTLRDTYARQDFSIPFRDIEDQADRDFLFRSHPDLEELKDTVQKRFEERGNTFERWYAENRRRINEERNAKMEQVAIALLNGTISKREYDNQRSYIRPYYSGYKAALWDAREKFDADTVKTIERYAEKQSANDKAVDAYQEIRNTPIIDPKTSMPDWDEVNRKLDIFLAGLPASVREYVLAHKDDYIYDYPDNAQKVELMRLRGIEDETWWDDYREAPKEWSLEKPVGKTQVEKKFSWE